MRCAGGRVNLAATTMADFSHLRSASLPRLAERLAAGWQPYDEYLFEALECISPPLLDDAHMEALREYFWPHARRRGRPRRAPIGRMEIARKVAATQISGPAKVIASYLHPRLLSGEPNSILPEWSKSKRFSDRHFRNALIKLLGDELGEILARGPPYQHPLLGDLDPGPIDPSLPARDRALTATNHVMRHRLAMRLPGIRRMHNIASEWSHTRWEVPPQFRHSNRNAPRRTT